MGFWSALARLFGARKPSPKPTPLTRRRIIAYILDIETRAPINGVTIRYAFDNGVTATVAGVNGSAQLDDLPNVPFTVTIEAAGYGTETGYYGTPGHIDRLPLGMRAIPKPVELHAGEKGRLRVDGKVFRREDGSIFPWRGCSDFALFARFCRGEDIGPVLNERIGLGFNLLRVFGMFDRFGIGGPQASGLGEFSPANTTGYYGKLRAFVDLMQSRGLRIEFVYFADADARSDGTGGLMTERAARQAHIDAIRSALLGTWGVAHELSNEAFKNFEDAESYTIDPALGVRAYGTKLPDGAIPTVWKILDYLTPHDHDRKDEWPRTARGYGEIVDTLGVPVVADEPIGFAEVARPGSRATDPNDAAYFAATMQMFASGSTFHSDDGVASRLFRPVQLEAAKAWAFGARWVPPEATLMPYQRGGECGTSGIGHMPIEHCDLDTTATSRALRSFAKTIGAESWAVRVRPVGPTMARDGWRIVEEPRLGFAKLAR